jgi:predicted DNA binding protein
MWYAKIKLKHDCIIGNRCKKFKCKSYGYPQGSFGAVGDLYFQHFEKIVGESNSISKFVKDLEKDENVESLQVNGNLVFFLYHTKNIGKMPSNIHLKKVMFVKPVMVDEGGYETWEVTSWDRNALNEFIEQTKKDAFGLEEFKIEKIVQSNLKEMYFAKVMPELSKEQGRALSLAISEGYYGYPRSVELLQLAKKMKISLSTYREHLRKAEKKVMPLLL